MATLTFEVYDDLTSERSREYKQLVIDSLLEYKEVVRARDLSQDEQAMIKELVAE